MAFDRLSVTITGRSQSAQQSIEDVSDQLRRLSRQSATTAPASLTVLAERLDEVSDEMNEASRAAAGTSASFTALGAASNNLGINIGFLSAQISATVLPAIGLLLTTLAPLVATVGTLTAAFTGLAGAFGLVVGSGILAFGQKRAEQNEKQLNQINEQIEQLEELRETEEGLSESQEQLLQNLQDRRDEIEETTSIMGALMEVAGDLADELTNVIAEFGERFIPLIEDAIDAFPELIRRIFESMGGFDEFERAVRDFGSAMMTVIPAVTGALFNLAKVALPVFADFANFLMNEGAQAFDAMIQNTQRLAPEFNDFLDSVIRLTPRLLELGTDVLEVILPPLSDILDSVSNLIDEFDDLDSSTQDLILSGLLLAPVISGLVGPMGSVALAAGVMGLAFTDANEDMTDELTQTEKDLMRLETTLINIGDVLATSIISAADLIGVALLDVIKMLAQVGKFGFNAFMMILEAAVLVGDTLTDQWGHILDAMAKAAEGKFGEAGDALKKAILDENAELIDDLGKKADKRYDAMSESVVEFANISITSFDRLGESVDRWDERVEALGMRVRERQRGATSSVTFSGSERDDVKTTLDDLLGMEGDQGVRGPGSGAKDVKVGSAATGTQQGGAGGNAAGEQRVLVEVEVGSQDDVLDAMIESGNVRINRRVQRDARREFQRLVTRGDFG